MRLLAAGAKFAHRALPGWDRDGSLAVLGKLKFEKAKIAGYNDRNGLTAPPPFTAPSEPQGRNRLRPIALVSNGRNVGLRRTQRENHADHGDSSVSVGRFDCTRTERQYRRYDHVR
jgi:hypothetical protein